MAKLKAAVIGVGGIGKWHAQMMRDTGKMQVCAVCDTNEALRPKMKEEFPEAVFYTDFAQMLAKAKPDVVGVITPHDLHAPISIAALKAGAHVVVEKPMATRYEDCLKMIQAARRAKRTLTVFHNRRLDGWFLAAKSVLDAGLLGNLVELKSAINFRPGPNTWRGWKEKSGGIVFDWGCHLVDYLLNLAGSEPKTVSGFFYRAAGGDPALNEDHGTVRIRFASGAEAEMTIYGTGQGNPLRYRLTGERGTLTDEWNWAEDAKLKVFCKLGGGEPTTMEVQYRKTVPQKFYDNFAAHLTEGAPLLVTPESAARVIRVLGLAEESHRRGGVPLPLG